MQHSSQISFYNPGEFFLLNTEVDFKISPPLSSRTPNLVLLDVKILVVDDCEENQFLFNHLLARKGTKVQTAGNGAEAIALARSEAFDIILMDIQMPIMDGFSALSELQTMGVKTPVIAITAESLPAQKQKIRDAGFSNVVTKPIDRNFLLEALLQSIEANTHG